MNLTIELARYTGEEKCLRSEQAIITSKQQYTSTLTASNTHVISDNKPFAHFFVASIIHPIASRQPGPHNASPSMVKAATSLCRDQPTCRSRSASFIRSRPTSAPDEAVARKHTIEQSTSSATCSVSKPCSICTATPTSLHSGCIPVIVFVLEGDCTITVNGRRDEPSSISTCKPVRATMAAAIDCKIAR